MTSAKEADVLREVKRPKIAAPSSLDPGLPSVVATGHI